MQQRQQFWGELTAFLALFFDNIGVLVFFSGILIYTFHYPADIVFTHMLPGTAVGVFCGDLIYTWLAIRLSKTTGRRDVTAMPLGLDTPSSIGLAFTVIGPAYVATHDAILTWHIGIATLLLIGLMKLVTAFIGDTLRRIIPVAGLLGSIAGVGLLLLAFLPLIELFNEIVVGMVALGLMFTMLLGQLALPGRLPNVLVAIIGGTALHLALGYSGLLPEFHAPNVTWAVHLPQLSFDFLDALPQALHYLPIAIPFALMTIIGGINNTESARRAGDDYRTRDILLTEALTSLIAAICGGVAQTTPYIGHPAYKKMGATHWYTLATGVLIGVGAVIGLLALCVQIIPRAVLAPIFLFIGFEMVHQAYKTAPDTHSPAVSFAFLPTIANLVMIIVQQFLTAAQITVAQLPIQLQLLHNTLTLLSNGFILTALLWGSFLAHLIERQPRHAAGYALLCAALSLFGVIHSVLPTGQIYWVGTVAVNTPQWLALGYTLLAVICLLVRVESAPPIK